MFCLFPLSSSWGIRALKNADRKYPDKLNETCRSERVLGGDPNESPATELDWVFFKFDLIVTVTVVVCY